MKNQKIIGFTSGYFDIMHPGHVLMLDECKMYCDYLIVGVHSFITQTPQPDGREKNQPIWTADERLMMVQSSKYVDKAFLYDGEEELYKYSKAELLTMARCGWILMALEKEGLVKLPWKKIPTITN